VIVEDVAVRNEPATPSPHHVQMLRLVGVEVMDDDEDQPDDDDHRSEDPWSPSPALLRLDLHAVRMSNESASRSRPSRRLNH
jgi:hypothetical protein